MTKPAENEVDGDRRARVVPQVANAMRIFAAVLPMIAGAAAFGQETATPSSEERTVEAAPGSSTAAPENTAQPPAPPTAAPPTSVLDEPWRARKALGAPGWLRFGLEHRLRFENLENDFHSAATGDSRGGAFRTLLTAELDFTPLVAGVELEDSREYASDATPIKDTMVNPIDVLQAYASLRLKGLLAEGDAAAFTVGRFTLDVGSRRLSARNEFRNTINTFTGVQAQWTSPGRHTVRAFAVMPVLRKPADSDAEGLADNAVALDRENTDALFSAVFFGSAPLAAGVQVEGYVFGLHERDSADAPSANRRLFTPGLRVLRAPAVGRFDLQVEGMVQLGTSRSSKKDTDTKDLTHRAFGLHVSGGRRFDVAWTPRVALAYDYGSGDRDPNDGVNGRFDTLFAARRFEFGPTGLFGAFGRSNLSSPALRVEVAPHRTVDAFAAYRLVWLASSRDSWVGADLRDNTGASGTFVGQQVEGRVRWNPYPKNLAFDAGAAYLVPGGFAKDAPGAHAGSPLFVYTQMTVTI